MSSEKNSKKIQPITAVILAAGKGTRMASPLPKVLHPVAGLPMIEYVLESCLDAGIEDMRVVLGHGQNLVKQVLEPKGVFTYTQVQQLGTADAVKSAQIETIDGVVVILNGDHPLIEGAELKKLIDQFHEEKLDLAVVSCELKNPKSFGRIVRSQGKLRAIVEAKDAAIETLKIREINTGIYIVKAALLADLLPKIKSSNKQNEFYLTDIISLAIEGGDKVDALKGSSKLAFGVNTQVELAQATKFVMRKKARQLLESGVILIDPASTYVESNVFVGAGSVIYPNVYLKGETTIGSFCVVESNCFLVDTQVEDSVQIRAGCYLEKAVLKTKASVGPYARLRPETVIGEEAHVGNFVEMKKVQFGAKAKAGHLAYLGDAEVGEGTNIGCGTITCNYAVDKKKYKTKIGKNVFVGSDSQFIAPVTIGDNAVIGSGSTITKDVPDRALAVARGKQFVKENYVKENKE